MTRQSPKIGPSPTRNADVIVVGAGIAGIAAAQLIASTNLSVIVLEARDRIGGRIWTSKSWMGIPLDLGASWVHGIRGNPIADLARNMKLVMVATKYDALALYNTQGQRVNTRTMRAIESRYELVLNQLNDVRSARVRDISLAAALRQIVAQQRFSLLEERELYYALASHIEHEYAADISNLSLLHWDEDVSFSGDDVILPNGYSQILDSLARKLDIRFEHRVSHIAHNAHGVTITTNEGVFTANRAIITLPLGVLKRKNIMFSPSLSERKQGAIDRLGMGVLNKVYLRFPRTFWDNEYDVLGYIPSTHGAWVEFLNMGRYVNRPVLVGFNAGNYALQLEAKTDRQIVREAVDVLQTMYGTLIPDPEAWQITRWGRDPFSYGSYSSIAPQATPEDFAILAEPVDERLFFAGEATAENYFGTVHGAFLSGQRAARESFL